MSHIKRRNALKLLGATTTLGILRPAWAQSPDDETLQRTFVLIHGAWHRGEAWDGVASRLRRAGHTVEAPTLPGMNPGDDKAGIDFDDYVQAVVKVVQRQPRKVTLVGHSSAGMILQAAAPYVAKKLDLVVFSNAFVMANGQSQLDNIPPEVAAFLKTVAQNTPDHTIPVEAVAGFIRTALMVGDPTVTQDALLASLTAQPFVLLSTPIETTAFEALPLPKAVLFCLRDDSAAYLHMARHLGRYHVVTANGSHEMLFSAPAGYTKALLKLVSFAHCAS